jgi:MFS transporter, YNFM family, putative membrane transport protein
MARFLDRRLAAVVLAGFSAFLGLYAPQPLLPMFREVFHVSTSRASQVVSFYTVAVALAAPLMGVLSDRWGRKKVMIPAAFLLSLPSMLAATSATFGQLLFWRFWQGAFTPGISASAIAFITEEWPSGAGSAMSAYVAGTVIGGFSGRLVAAFIASQFSWRMALLTLGILNFGCAVGILAWLPAETKPRIAHRHSDTLGIVLGHLRNPGLIGIYAVGFCVLYTMIGAFTFINFRLAAPPFGWSTTALGLLFTIYLLAAILTMGAGRRLDRFGHQRAALGALSLTLVGILITLFENSAAVLIGLTLLCSGVFIGQAAANSYIGQAAQHGRAVAVGLYTTFYYVGGSVGAVVPGFLWGRWGWSGCVAAIAMLQTITIVFAALVWKTAIRRPRTAVHRTSDDFPAPVP